MLRGFIATVDSDYLLNLRFRWNKVDFTMAVEQGTISLLVCNGEMVWFLSPNVL